jgi:CMP-N-acetylneuraminic acid synthetase
MQNLLCEKIECDDFRIRKLDVKVDYFSTEFEKSIRILPTNLRFIKKSLLTAKNLSLTQRQYAEKVYAVNGSIFLTKVSNIKKFKTFHSKKKSKYIICDTKFSIDLNNLDDVKRLEIFFKNNKKFNF